MRSFQPANLKFWFAAASVIFILAAALPAAAGWIVWQTARNRLPMEIRGTFRPVLFRTEFEVSRLFLNWENKVEVKDGRLHVDYDWPGPRTHVVMTSGRMPLVLGGDWSSVSSARETVLEHFFADLELGQEGIRDINRIEARSPEMQFNVGTEKR